MPHDSPDSAAPAAHPSRAASRPPIGPRALAALLAALAMLGPFSVDTYLPAFPDIARSLAASPIQIQQTLTAYMAAFAVMILWHGALSDALGRRAVILVSLAVFAVASLGCAASVSVQYLWAFRMLQGVSAGAGVVVGRAMIRDRHAGPEAERLLSLVTMLFAIGPAIAPVLGGWIVSLADWRTIFLFLFVYAALLAWLCQRRLPETHPASRRTPLSARVLWASYLQVLRSAPFHLKAGVVSFNFAGLFLYVAAAPTFLIQHLGLGAHEFAWQFVPSVAGIFLGALAANRLAGRIASRTQVRIGFALLAAAALGNVGYHVAWPPALPWSVLPLFFYCFGMSMVAPPVTLQVLDLFPNVRGVAASCQSFAQTMLAAVVAGVIAPLLAPSVLWLAAGQLGFVAAGLACWRLSRLPAMRAAARPPATGAAAPGRRG